METEATEGEGLDFDAAFDKAWDEGGESTPEGDSDSSGTPPPDVLSADQDSEGQPTDAETQSEPEGEGEPLAAPVGLSESAKADFYKMPREGQQLFLARYREMEADYTRKTQEIAERRREAEEIEQALAPFEADIVASGQGKGEILSYMLRWNSLLNRDPVRGLQRLASQLQVPISIGASDAQNRGQSFGDSANSELEQRLAALEAERAEIAERQQSERLQAQLRGLAEEKDGAGKEVRPMFKELVPAIQGLVTVLASDPEHEGKSELELVELAYQRAYEPYRKARESQILKQVERSKSAKLAGSSISSSSTGGVPARAKIRSTDDAVDRAFSDLGL